MSAAPNQEHDDQEEFSIFDLIEQLPEKKRLKMMRVVHYILEEGLLRDEALLLANIPNFDSWLEEFPQIEYILQVAELKFKREILRPLVQNAKMNQKEGRWLLEQRYPEEFANSPSTRKFQPTGEPNQIQTIIQFIQQNGDSQPLVATHTTSPDAKNDTRTLPNSPDRPDAPNAHNLLV